LDPSSSAAAPATPAAPPPRTVAELHAGEIIELTCRASEILEESVELQVLKCLLTAVSSKTFRVHGRALLRAVRTCYNIFLGSKSEVNQSTAKASLTQMLTVVFYRLEADSAEAPAPTIVVADLLRPGAHAKDDDTVVQVVQFVQQFVNKVISDINAVSTLTTMAAAAGALTGGDGIVEVPPGWAKQEVTEAEFDNDDTVAHTTGGGTPTVEGAGRSGSTDGEQGGASSEHSEGGGDSADPPALEAAAGVAAAAGSVATEAAVATGTEAVMGAGGEAGALTSDPTPVTSKSKVKSKESEALATDAFLVFRALCKLAKKPGDLQNVAVVRGKTLSLELLKILLENAGPVFRTSPRFIDATKAGECITVLSDRTPQIFYFKR
jgi:brefeldin A-inhibited guanine nucleotide-exchange protein